VHVAFSLLTLAPGAVGGSESYARGLLGAFAQGHGPERVTVLIGPALEGGGAVEVRQVAPRIATRGVARLAGLLRGMARRDPSGADVLHHPLTVPAPHPRGPSVLTLHDVLHRELPLLFSRFERSFRRLAYERAARGATRVVTVSEYARGQIVQRVGIAPDRVVAIHSGVDHGRFDPTGPAESPTAGPFVLYPANLWPHKNHERLISALGQIEGLALVLTGAPSPRLAALKDRARREGVEMRHLGYVDDLAPLYRAARALVFPSLAEGWGAPVVEAMACGCPVAASDSPAVAEAVGGAAAAFPPHDVAAMADAIHRVTADDGLREQLRGQGLDRAAQLTWHGAAERHAEVYAEALRTAVRRGAPTRPGR
jgi:glycosyltransferase involved in cell wall biosynthesis